MGIEQFVASMLEEIARERKSLMDFLASGVDNWDRYNSLVGEIKSLDRVKDILHYKRKKFLQEEDSE